MGITVDVAYKSFNKFGEVLCGDKVEMLKTEDSDILILADGIVRGKKSSGTDHLTGELCDAYVKRFERHPVQN